MNVRHNIITTGTTYVVEYIFKQCFKVDSYGILVIPGTVLPVFIERTYVRRYRKFKKKNAYCTVLCCTVQIFVLTWCHFFHQVFLGRLNFLFCASKIGFILYFSGTVLPQ